MEKKSLSVMNNRQNIERERLVAEQLSTPNGRMALCASMWVPMVRTINPFMTAEQQRIHEYNQFIVECRKRDKENRQ